MNSLTQGADVSPLGVFSWELQHNNDKTRPVFIVSDSFVKLHRIRRPRTFVEPIIAPAEFLNYTNLAIKWSRCLTKDMAFSGVRDILKKIGHYIDRCYEFEVAFSFGTLRSKDRRVKFEFNIGALTKVGLIWRCVSFL